MAYGDVPFAEQTALFPTRQTVLRYLEDFAHEHDLTRHIDFNTKVLSVKRVAQGWRITTMYEEAVTQSLFDRIVVASGHYETPLLPDIEGISDFDKLYPDVISHSKYYRSPEAFAHLKTVVVGNGPSGIDIVSQIAHTPGAQLPLLRSIRSSSKSPMPAAQVQDVAEIVAFCADRSLLLKDGTRITDVDRVLFCTGYLYAFPFLDAPRIVTNGLRLHKLYKQILWQDDPTLAFLGMEMSIVPFPYSEAQACYLARVWANRLTLPSKAIMQQEEAERVAIRGDGRGFMFRSHPEDGAYIQELRELCIQADEGHGKGKGLMPVDWSGDRFALRAQGPALRRAWLEEKEKRAS
jgi:cation diffusion facilitator CzcD-associated flavoprotein CzcO